MKSLRHLIQKGDPRLKAKIPIAIKKLVVDAAKVGKRRPQDEVIKRLLATFKNEDAYQDLKNKLQVHFESMPLSKKSKRPNHRNLL